MQQDEKYRNSQRAYGWTEEYCRYLDNLTKIDISHIAPWHWRHWYESTITLVCNEEDRQRGPMKARKDFKPTTKIPGSLRQERGRQNSFYSEEREIEALQAKLGRMSQKMEDLIIFTQLVATRTSRHSMA